MMLQLLSQQFTKLPFSTSVDFIRDEFILDLS